MKKHLLLFLFAIVCFVNSTCFAQVCIPQATLSLPLSYNNNAPSVISGLRISNGTGGCIELNNCHNVTISNCILGASSGEAIVLRNCTNITITNCLFKDMLNGLYALQSQGIKVNYNQFTNIQYQPSRGQFVQFDKVYGAGNEIMYNVGENIPGNSSAEDLVNIYQSNGTAASPILVKGNRFRGGGPRGSSGGILACDDGGSYITVEDNILVDPGGHGIGIPSGTNIVVRNNRVYGRQQPWTESAGIYIFRLYGSRACDMNTVEYNTVNWTRNDGVPNSAYNGLDCGIVAGWNTNSFGAPITDTILPARILCPELTAYYKFNNSWVDETGNGLTASSNGPSIATGCEGGYVQFNGTTGHRVTLPRSAGLRPSLQRISVSCWIKPATVTGIKGIARGQDGNGWDNSWRMIINDNVFNPHITTDQGPADVYYGGLQAGVWAHVVMTYDGKQLKAYVDGVLRDAANISGNILYYPSLPVSMEIGFANGDYYFNGQLDEFRFYAGDLSASEVSDLYNLHKDNFECLNQLITSRTPER